MVCLHFRTHFVDFSSFFCFRSSYDLNYYFFFFIFFFLSFSIILVIVVHWPAVALLYGVLPVLPLLAWILCTFSSFLPQSKDLLILNWP